MNQLFIAWIKEAERLQRRYPKADWANLAGAQFWTHHKELQQTSPEAYKTLWHAAFDEVKSRLGVSMTDYNDQPF